jgi:hypothetical protein
VWSILIAVAILTGYALKLTVLGDGDRLEHSRIARTSWLSGIAQFLSLYVVALCVINFGSVIVQCGLGECHTDGYALLK